MRQDPFPMEVCVWGSAPGPQCNLTALYQNPVSHSSAYGYRAFRSVYDPEHTHRAGVRWRSPVSVSRIEIGWCAGYQPKSYKIFAEIEDNLVPLQESWLAAGDENTVVELQNRRITGLQVHQKMGGGSTAHPNELHLSHLVVVPTEKPTLSLQLITQDGPPHSPPMPFWEDNNPQTFLDVGCAQSILVRRKEARPCWGIALDLAHVGSVGIPNRLVNAFTRHLTRINRLKRNAFSGQFSHLFMDSSQSGIACGVSTLFLAFSQRETMDRLTIPLPNSRGGLMALNKILWLEERPELLPAEFPLNEFVVDAHIPTQVSRSAEQGDDTAHHPGPTGALHPGEYTGVIGLPATVGRGAYTPLSTLQLSTQSQRHHAGSQAASFHLAFGVSEKDGQISNLSNCARTLEWVPQKRSLTTTLHTLQNGLSITLRLSALRDTEEGRPLMNLEFEVCNKTSSRRHGILGIGVAARDGWWPLPLTLSHEDNGDERIWFTSEDALFARGDLSLRLVPGESDLDEGQWEMPFNLEPGKKLQSLLQLSMGPAGDTQGKNSETISSHPLTADPIPIQLPEASWNRLLHLLLRQAALFFGPEDQISYGIFPSVYKGSRFGLEEDYLLSALARWGHPRLALKSFRSTFLTEEHLSKSHYLHDLRNGLTPWQAWRHLQLNQLPFNALSGREKDLLLSLGAWIISNRKSLSRPGAEGSFRTYPGLLPSGRYGGDLGFQTQSFVINAANCVGLEKLAELAPQPLSDRFSEEAHAYRNALLEAITEEWERHPGRLYTGGGEPGPYETLLSSGVLYPLNFFSPESPHLHVLDRIYESEESTFQLLPRFDEWGTPEKGLDPQYAIGYLVCALQQGKQESYWKALSAFTQHCTDPSTLTFREVSPLHDAHPPWDATGHLPGLSLSRSEPCCGTLGVLLQLLLNAVISCWRSDPLKADYTVSFLAGIPPTWWSGDPLTTPPLPSLCGPVSVAVSPLRNNAMDIQLCADGAKEIRLYPPVLEGMICTGWQPYNRKESTDPLNAPYIQLQGGQHHLVCSYGRLP